MKIEIIAPNSPFTKGYTIRAKGKLYKNFKSMFGDFSEIEIESIVNEKLSDKYLFDVPAWKLNYVNNGGANLKSHLQLKWAIEYDNL